MTNHHEAIIEILASARKLTAKRELLANTFQSAGIILDDRLMLVSLTSDAETCVKTLMNNLSPLPVVKVWAQHILRHKGLTV